MRGVGFRCDVCDAAVAVPGDAGPPVPPEGWVVLSFPVANPFGPDYEDEAHACSWRHAAELALQREGKAS